VSSREDLDNPHVIPDGIPVPVDDGACNHLEGATLPLKRRNAAALGRTMGM